MKILFVVPRFHTNQYQMVMTLQQNGHDVFFHVASKGAIEDYSLLTPFRYRQSRASKLLEKLLGVGGVNRPNYFPSPVKYGRAFRKLKPDIVIIRDPYKVFSFMAAFFAVLTRAKIIFYTQEELLRDRSKKALLKQDLFMQVFNAAWMMPIKGSTDGSLKKLGYRYFVPLPVPTKQVQRAEAVSMTDEPRLLMVGKYHQARKNHLLLLEVVRLLKTKYKFKVTMVGECTRPQQVEKFKMIKEQIHQMELSDLIELKQNVPFCDMAELYAAHDVFVLPAVDEQYGISVTEALGYGLPVICTDTCGARFNIQDGSNGLVVKSNSLDALVQAVETLLISKEKRQEMHVKALRYSQEYLSGSAFYSSFSFLLQDCFGFTLSNCHTIKPSTVY